MKTERYFFNEETSELTILSQDGDDSQIVKLSELCSYEYEDEDPIDDPQEEVPDKEDEPDHDVVVGGGSPMKETQKRLTPGEKEQILDALDKGGKATKIAERFGVSAATVYKIKRDDDKKFDQYV